MKHFMIIITFYIIICYSFARFVLHVWNKPRSGPKEAFHICIIVQNNEWLLFSPSQSAGIMYDCVNGFRFAAGERM